MAAGIGLGIAAADVGNVQGQRKAMRIRCRNLPADALKHTPVPGRVGMSVLRDGTADRLLQLKPWQMGRTAWLFIGSEMAGQRAAVLVSLVQPAKLTGHEPWAYLHAVLARLPMHLNSQIGELLPHRWLPASRAPHEDHRSADR